MSFYFKKPGIRRTSGSVCLGDKLARFPRLQQRLSSRSFTSLGSSWSRMVMRRKALFSWMGSHCSGKLDFVW